MSKVRQGPSGNGDFVLASLTVIALAATAYGIELEMAAVSRVTRPVEESIGAVVLTFGTPKRRAHASLVWDRLLTGEPVWRGDGVFVPAEGVVEITFRDDSRITLDESSLVVFDAPEASEAAHLKLREGSLTGRPGRGGLRIVTPKAEARLSPGGDVSIAAASDETIVTVRRGGAMLRTEAGELRIRAGERGAVRGRGIPAATPLMAVLLEPEAAARVYFAARRGSILFTWQPITVPVVFELADDRGFSRLLFVKEASGGSLNVSDLAPGAYYWRVRDPAGTWTSEARSVRLVRDLPPEPIAPSRGQVLYVPPDEPARFWWAPVAGASRYRLQIARDPAFEDVVIERDLDVPEATLLAFGPEGIYYWRARALSPERGESPYSRPLPFRLILEPLPAAPELYDPEVEGEMEAEDGAPPGPAPELERNDEPPAGGGPRGDLLWLLLGGVARAATPPPPDPEPARVTTPTELTIVLRWSAVAGVRGYVLEIADSESFENVVVRAETREPYYRWRTASRQPHFWRVQSVDAKGRTGTFSPPRPVRAALAAPLLRTPLAGARATLTAPPSSVVLSWEPERLAARYEIEAARDATFTELTTRLASNTAAATLVLSNAGTLYWRVRGLDATGAPGAFSEPRALQVDLATPSPEPAADAGYVASSEVVLRASPVAAAKTYVFEITDENARNPSPAVREASAPAVKWSPAAPGVYAWRVRARGEGEASSPWSARTSFVVAPPAPILTAPEDGERLAFRTPEDPVTLRWNAVPGATAYRIEVRATEEEEVAIAESSQPEIVLRGLHAGAHDVQVFALAHGRRSAPSSPVRIERVLLPPVPTPALESPGAGERQLTREASTKVRLVWRRDAEAARYEVELASLASAPAPAGEPRRWTTEDNAIEPPPLAPGTYSWRVRAVAADGMRGAFSAPRSFYCGPPVLADARVTVDPDPVPLAASEPARLRIEVHDELGAVVAGAPLAATARLGAIRALSETAPGVFTGDYHPPTVEPTQDEQDEIVLRLGDDPAVERRARVALRRASADWRLGLAVGAAANFRGRRAATIAAEAEHRLRRGAPWRVTARVGYERTTVEHERTPASSATQTVVPAALGARYLLPPPLAQWPLTPYFVLNGLVGLFHVRVRVRDLPSWSQIGLALGAEGAAGVEYRLGGLALFAELRYGWLGRRDDVVTYASGGMGATLGFRLEP